MLRCGVMAYLFLDVIIHWKAYSSCYAPIQLFHALGYVGFIVATIILRLLTDPGRSEWLVKSLTFFWYWIFTSFMIYLPIQGLIWQIENMTKTKDCVPSNRLPGFTWVWLACMALWGFFMGLMAFAKIRNWIAMRSFRRRMFEYQGLIERGDYEALNQLLEADGDINNRAGLLSVEIDRLTTQKYSQSEEMLSLSHSEQCPICFEDYKNGDEVMTLPKCKHAFHPICIKGWLVKSSLCPMCRANVRTNLYDAHQNQARDPNRGRDLENPLVNNNQA